MLELGEHEMVFEGNNIRSRSTQAHLIIAQCRDYRNQEENSWRKEFLVFSIESSYIYIQEG